MYYEDDDEGELSDFYYDAQYHPVIHNQQPAINRPETPRAEREITRLARFSSLYPEEDIEKLRAVLEDCDYKLEKAIELLKELKNDNKKAVKQTKCGPQEKQVKRLAQSGVVPKRHTPEAIESKLEMILEMYPNANDTAIRHRLEDSIDLDLEVVEIVNELQTPEEASEDRNVSENNFQEIDMDRGMEEYLSEEDKNNLLHITQIFPDADPHFLFEQIAVQLKSLETIVDEMTRDSNYPKLKQRLENERQESRRQEFLNFEFDIESYLQLFEDPETYFNDQTRNTTDLYTRHALVHLMNLFRNMRDDFLQRQLEIHNNHLLPTIRTISNGSSDKDADGRRKKTTNFGMAQYTYEERAVIPWPEEIDEMFFRELQYLQHEQQVREFLAERKRQHEQREREAEVKGQLLECQCCLHDNKLPEDMLACQENVKHVFCRGCVRQHGEMQVSQGFHRVVCMTGFCSAEYNIGMLQNLLRSASMDILLRRRQQDELRNAQLDNMESCPFCDFAMVIENTNEKVFKCQNPVCLRESCRQCKESNHIPLRCNEVEKDAETRMRTYIENKMAEAWIRICPKCSKRLIKTDGCNALHCPCGAGICYVCNELLPKESRGYGHFAGVGVEPNVGYRTLFTWFKTASKAKCPLHTELNAVNADVAERAGKEARALYLQENPNGEKEKEKMDDERVEQLVDRQANSSGYERVLRGLAAGFGAAGMRGLPQHPRFPPVDYEAMREKQRQDERQERRMAFFQQRHAEQPAFGQREELKQQQLVAQHRVQQIEFQRDHLRQNIVMYSKDIEQTVEEIQTSDYRDAMIELNRKLERLQRSRQDAMANLELSRKELNEANAELNRIKQLAAQDDRERFDIMAHRMASFDEEFEVVEQTRVGREQNQHRIKDTVVENLRLLNGLHPQLTKAYGVVAELIQTEGIGDREKWQLERMQNNQNRLLNQLHQQLMNDQLRFDEKMVRDTRLLSEEITEHLHEIKELKNQGLKRSVKLATREEMKKLRRLQQNKDNGEELNSQQGSSQKKVQDASAGVMDKPTATTDAKIKYLHMLNERIRFLDCRLNDSKRKVNDAVNRMDFDDEMRRRKSKNHLLKQFEDTTADRNALENVLLRDGVEKWRFQPKGKRVAAPTRPDRLFGRNLPTVNARLPNPQQQDQSVQYNFGDVQVPAGAAVHIQEFDGVQYAVAVHNVGSKDKDEPAGITQRTQSIRQNTRDTRTVKTPALVVERNAMVEELVQLEQQMLNERDRLNQESQAVEEQIEVLQRQRRQIQEQMILSDRRLAQAREKHVIELDRLNSAIAKMEIHHPSNQMTQKPTASINVDKSDENLKKNNPEPSQSTVEEMDSNDSVCDVSNVRSNKTSSVDRIVRYVKKSIPNVERQQVISALLKLRERMGGRVKNESFLELVKLVVNELKPVCSVHPIQRKSVAELNIQIPQSTIPLNQTGENNQHVVTEQETAQPLQIVEGHASSTMIPNSGNQASVSGLTSNNETGVDNSTLTMRICRDGELNINIHLPRQEVQTESQQNVLSESDQTEKGLNLEQEKIDADVDLIDFGSD